VEEGRVEREEKKEALYEEEKELSTGYMGVFRLVPRFGDNPRKTRRAQ
jgi:hypothetical protein